MTAESTVPSPGGGPREHRFSSVSAVSVIPPRESVGGFRFPAGRRPALRPASPLPLLAADGIAALLGVLALTGPQRHAVLVGALLIGVVALNARASLYRPESVPAFLDELPAVCGRIALGWLSLAALVGAIEPADALSAHTLVVGCAVQATVSAVGRATIHWRRRRALLRRPHTALVIGPAGTARRVATAFLRHPACGVRPVGLVTDHPDGVAGLPVLTTGEEVQRALIQNGVRAVLTVHPSVRAEQGPLLRALAESGCTLWEIDAESPSYESAERLAGFSCRRLAMGPDRPGSLGKRLLDVTVSGTLLLLFSPLLLLCAVVLRLTGGRGVVFRQERIGKDGRPFTLLKFRTHRPVNEMESATRWSVADEQRMNWFCRLLRRTSMDELLQLWNVLWGDMSLVGPRPERPYFVGKFSQTYPGYAARHRMQTGITGLAQIHGLRGDTSIEDRCRFDNAYIDNWSLWQDICILLRTAATLVRPTGS
ncbi:exopolysaccharide biosynthesis polyprenyl glycosylphosphotransferase [Streptomyces turgidiscabies]|uniref:exopolysaccharide biosynthesis polyprenyl glycosylphosphotransferase n=1 Tax=Streptomyces TaxID=1883 RepID=UPI0005CB2389|nr:MULTISPECIES: exopolysaccharide biosynthesis polyprenyl glycosylphosphotransferase [Streptomyces]MDX3497639.1 exopolysaccharide biosynthesis polyprenyl glycosylphosphotransferase [Streptomyces turgidiscabies]GAQ76067.1 UDP-glucose:undecaprenyl-phosphate glucose-1-phosphate transferase [Streptomyces turgidiscabies]